MLHIFHESASIYSLKVACMPVTAGITYDHEIIFSPDGDRSGGSDSDSLTETGNRLYRTVAGVEGIWIIAVQSESGGTYIDSATGAYAFHPEYYDFYIRTCWYKPTQDYPTTIGTIVRLYNPEIME